MAKFTIEAWIEVEVDSYDEANKTVMQIEKAIGRVEAVKDLNVYDAVIVSGS